MEVSIADQQALERLQELLRKIEKIAVAFSGGVDSTFLAAVAHETLGNQVLAITLAGHAAPQRDIQRTRDFCKERGIAHEVVSYDELSIPQFAANTPDRCYHCKKALFTKMLDVAQAHGISTLVDGSNVDDEGDYRPGMRALSELGIGSPLREAGLTKSQIRTLSRAMNLPTWDMPSAACLASRFSYGQRITAEKLARVGQAEDFLHDLGIAQLRVRVHGDNGELARIEVPESCIEKIASEANRTRIVEYLRTLGFTYVSLDLQGFRSGAMNEVL